MRWSILLLLAARTMFGSILFSEDFESVFGLATNWSTNSSGQIVANPLVDVDNPSANVLQFNSTASGGDIFSFPFSEPGGEVILSFDFLWTDSNANTYIGTDHQAFCCNNEEWLWSSGNNGTHPLGSPPLNTWNHISFAFTPYDPGGVGSILLKMELNAPPTASSFFDNIQVQTPEPSQAAPLLFGLGALAAGYRRRRKASAAS